MFYKIATFNIFAKFTGKHLRWSLCNLILKKRLQHRWTLRRFPEYLFLQNTSRRLLITFHCSSLVKKNLSGVLTIGLPSIWGVLSETKVCTWAYFSQWGFSLFLHTWNLKISECYFQYFQLKCHAFFIKMLLNCDNQSFQEYCVSMKICFHLMEKL